MTRGASDRGLRVTGVALLSALVALTLLLPLVAGTGGDGATLGASALDRLPRGESAFASVPAIEAISAPAASPPPHRGDPVPPSESAHSPRARSCDCCRRL